MVHKGGLQQGSDYKCPFTEPMGNQDSEAGLVRTRCPSLRGVLRRVPTNQEQYMVIEPAKDFSKTRQEEGYFKAQSQG